MSKTLRKHATMQRALFCPLCKSDYRGWGVSIDWKGLRVLHGIHVTREDTREENNKGKDCVIQTLNILRKLKDPNKKWMNGLNDDTRLYLMNIYLGKMELLD